MGNPPQQPPQNQASSYFPKPAETASASVSESQAATDNASKASEPAEPKKAEEQSQPPKSTETAASTSAAPFNFDFPPHKMRLIANNRKDGWHKYLNDEDRRIIENILKEAAEFDEQYLNFEKEYHKMTSATSCIGDNSLKMYNTMWSDWKTNLLSRREQMNKLQEVTLDNHYKKVCQNYPLFITKPTEDNTQTASNGKTLLSSSEAKTLPDPSNQQPLISKQPPLIGNTPPLLPNPPNKQPLTARQTYRQRKNRVKQNNANMPDITDARFTAPPFETPQVELPDETAKSAVYSTDTVRDLTKSASASSGNNNGSGITYQTIPGISIHDMGKVRAMLEMDESISRAVSQTINDADFQSAHNDFSFMRHQAKFIHDLLMYQKTRPKKNAGGMGYGANPVSGVNVNVNTNAGPKKGWPAQMQDRHAPAVQPVAPVAPAGGAMALLDNALDNALKMLKESRAKSSGAKSYEDVDSDSQSASNYGSQSGNNKILTLTPAVFKIQSIGLATSSKSKYNSTKSASLDVLPVLTPGGTEEEVVDSADKKLVKMKLNSLGPGHLKSKAAKTFVLAADEDDLEELEAKGRQLLDITKKAVGRPRCRIRSRDRREKESSSRRSDSDRDRDRDRSDRERDRGRPHDRDWDRDRERDRHDRRREDREPSPAPPRSSFKSTYFEGSNSSGGPPMPVPAPELPSDIESFLKQERAQLENSTKSTLSEITAPRLSYTEPRFFTVPRKFTEEALYIKDLMELPARQYRPPRIVLIIRGLPGSGKSTLARAIKEHEEAASPLSKIRLLSLDDYFVVEKAIGDELQLVYEYDQTKESDYKCNLFKAFRKTLLSGYGDFVILDSVNASLTDVRHYYACAVENNFIPYVIEMEAIVRRLLDDCIAGEEIIAHCYKHNRHGRSLAEIRALYDSWELLPAEYLRVDAYSMAAKLAESGAIQQEAPRFRPKVNLQQLSSQQTQPPMQPQSSEEEVGGMGAVAQSQQPQQQQMLTVHSDYDTEDVPTVFVIGYLFA